MSFFVLESFRLQRKRIIETFYKERQEKGATWENHPGLSETGYHLEDGRLLREAH